VVVEISENQGHKHICQYVSISAADMTRPSLAASKGLYGAAKGERRTAYLRISASILTAEEVV
jgi:hypothetical protein